MLIRRILKGIIPAMLLVGCASSGGYNPQADLIEIAQRDIAFPAYPQAGVTYLSFSRGHGFQVNYIAPAGKSYLWYPGNRRAVPEEWVVRSNPNRVCWRHPSASYNPVTRSRGGNYQCQDLRLSRRSIVSSLVGDPFGLANGTVPFQRDRCVAPSAFVFDRNRFGC